MSHPIRLGLLFAALLGLAAGAAARPNPTLLVRSPSVSENHLAFVYAGDVWIARRDGGDPRRLTVHPGLESGPQVSPDGRYVAFTGHYDGNEDAYVVPLRGGQPVRLTYHPGADRVRGWTPDGAVLLQSSRASHTTRTGKLFRVPVEGGLPEELPIPAVQHAAMSPDGARVAYTPFRDAFSTWKHYRGGRTTPVWIIELATGEAVEVPHVDASDSFPVWLGDTVYFLSDRAGTMNVFAYDGGDTVQQVTSFEDYDVKDLAAGGGALVIEQGGRLHDLDPVSGETTAIPIAIAPDLPELRPHFEDGAAQITWAEISPTGQRAVFAARGDVFTVPAEHGDVRNLTRTPGVHERFPRWSPDGARVAYVSDASGEYQLHIADQAGTGEPRVLPLGGPSFYHAPLWSPDGVHVAYTDKRLNLWVLPVAGGAPRRVDTDTYDHPPRSLDPAWSPDGRWLAYTKRLDNHLRAVFLYDTEAGTTHQITDGMSDCTSAQFSLDGRYLFFAASTNFALNTGWLDMSSYERPVRRSLYVVVLAADQPSPLAPRSDEEPVEDGGEGDGEGKKDGKGKKAKEAKQGEDEGEGDEPVVVTVDLDGIDQRILALPVGEGDHRRLQAAEGALFFLERPAAKHASWDTEGGLVLQRFDLEEREGRVFLEGVVDAEVSHDGKKLYYQTADGARGIVETGAEGVAPGDGALDLSGMRVWVDPRAEYEQIYEEVFRIQRDYFYDPGLHGIDWAAVHDAYRPWLDHVGHRDDLNYLIGEIIGELVVGHAYRWGGDYPDVEQVGVGLLGADLEVAGDRYRIARIYSGENWNPELRAPLTEPGVDVRQGDYLLAIDGLQLRAPDNPYRLLQGRDGKQVRLTVNDRPALDGAREVTVVPTGSEEALRHFAWVEGNRARVDEATGGRVAYVYVPNTAWAGYTYFNRYFYAQLDKQAVIVDERYNGGGSVADYMIDMLGRRVLNWHVTREGEDYSSPLAVIDGPKAMIINEDAGSGGDCLPHYFRLEGLGPLIGTRTWGGLIGIYDYPELIDGGVVTAPRIAFYGPDGRWTAENVGVAPDIEVVQTPKAVLAGGDPQLEKAIEVVLQELERNPPVTPRRPPFPDYSRKD